MNAFKAFNKIDLRGSGRVSAADIRDFLLLQKAPVDEGVIADAIVFADADYDGTVNMEEFVK